MESRTPSEQLPKLSFKQATYEETLNHLVVLAKTPGWKAYAWHKALELESDQTGIWVGISNDLTERMK